ncbi:MAG: carbohydrate kinase family protein [Oricola sp.]|nr:carbohydrate kinase family protein [Oricola sp.]
MSPHRRAIAVIGNANIDIVAGSIDDWPAWGTEIFLPRSDFRIGGSAANTALVLGLLGSECGLISACGEDETGNLISRRFSGPLDRIAVLPARTSLSIGILKTDGERSFLSTDGHLDALDADFYRGSLRGWPLDGALALVSGAFALPALADGHSSLLRWLKDNGAETAIDPGWPGDGWTAKNLDRMREWLTEADHILLNEDEACGVTGQSQIDAVLDALENVAGRETRIIVKRGAAGAMCRCNGVTESATGTPLAVVDTVGAGDAFNAGYLYAVAGGSSIGASLKQGITVAEHVIAEFPRTGSPIATTG